MQTKTQTYTILGIYTDNNQRWADNFTAKNWIEAIGLAHRLYGAGRALIGVFPRIHDCVDTRASDASTRPPVTKSKSRARHRYTVAGMTADGQRFCRYVKAASPAGAERCAANHDGDRVAGVLAGHIECVGLN
jgi:hypothetical protein